MDVLARERPCHGATAGRADEGGKGRTSRIQNDNAVQPFSTDALGGGRARRGGGPHGLAQQGEDSSVEKQRYYSLTPLPPKRVPLHPFVI